MDCVVVVENAENMNKVFLFFCRETENDARQVGSNGR